MKMEELKSHFVLLTWKIEAQPTEVQNKDEIIAIISEKYILQIADMYILNLIDFSTAFNICRFFPWFRF